MGIKPGILHAEKQMKGWGGPVPHTVQRDFGVKGGIEKDNGFIDEKPFIIAPEIIASLPGGDGDAISGDAIGIEGARDIGPGSENIGGQADFIGGCGDVIHPGTGNIGGGSNGIDKTSGTGAIIKQPGDGI